MRARARVARVRGEDRICVGGSHEVGKILRRLPGARWKSDTEEWTIPATPGAASGLRAAASSLILVPDEAVASLMERAVEESEQHSEFRRELDLTPLPFDPAMQPWKHQLGAFNYAVDRRATLLWCKVGSGKTKMALDIVRGHEGLDEHPEVGRVVLVVCKQKAIDGWAVQIDQHYAGETEVLRLNRGTSTTKARLLVQALSGRSPGDPPLFVVVNYESVWRGQLGSTVESTPLQFVIADEVHKVKSPGGRASWFMSKLARHQPGAIRLGLSGTTVENPLEAYGVMRFIDRGVFGTSFVRHRNRYAVMGGYENHQVIGWQNMDEFHDRMRPYVYFVGEEGLDVPPHTHVRRSFSLSPDARAVYDELRGEFILSLGDGEVVNATNALTRLLRLQEMTGGFVRDEAGDVLRVGGDKAEALADVLDEIDVDERLVIFCRFHPELDLIRRVVEESGRSTCEISGRSNGLADWEAGLADVAVVQIQAGGESIDTLKSAAIAIFWSITYSLREFEQAVGRIVRSGQTRETTLIHLVAEKTVDEVLYRALDRKADFRDYIVRNLRNV